MILECDAPPAGPHLKHHIGSHMAAARVLTAAELLAKQLAQELKVKKDREQEAERKAANNPAAWVTAVRNSTMDKEAKQEERSRGMTAVFAETERTRDAVEKLSTNRTP